MRGKVFCNISGYISVWDHPRMCGEKTFLEQKRPPRLGSPPHVRGKVRKAKKAVRCTWITPACAGKRNWQCSTTRPEKDHPRMCGEKGSLPMLLDSQRGSPPHVRGKEGRCKRSCVADTGSPPHVRGKVEHRVGSRRGRGITPACAGKRLKRSRSTVPPVAIVPLFPSVCNKPVVSDGSPAGRDAPLFLPAENAVPASPAYNLRSL